MGLRHKELEEMVLPLISIDEFEPKMGTVEEIIVVAFFCKDELPAYDLDEFIDKSVVEFLDSEVSPNPNEDGLYLVFVEFKRQPNFWLKLYKLVKDIENVTGKQDWKVQPYLVDKLFGLYDKALHEVVITKEENYLPKVEFSKDPSEYLEDSDLLDFKFDESKKTAIFRGGIGSVLFDYVDFDESEKLEEKLELNEAFVDLMGTSPSITALRSLLGSKWDVSAIDSYVFVNKHGDPRSLVLKRK